MRYAREFAVNAVVRGVLVLLPLYLAVLVTLKGMQSVVDLLRPSRRCFRKHCRLRTLWLCWQC